MYDDKEIEIEDKAILLIVSVRSALAGGTKHYRKSDNKLLITEHEILEAMRKEGGIYFELKGGKEDESGN